MQKQVIGFYFSSVMILSLLHAKQHSVFAADCKTEVSLEHHREEQVSVVDNKKYSIISIPGLEQKATSIKCLSNQSCVQGQCQQDYKNYQFLAVPYGKEQLHLDDLRFRLFQIPYGCKCT